MPADTDQARLIEGWEAGKLAIIATLAEGPMAGKAVVCLTPRKGFRDGLPGVQRSLRRTSTPFLHNLVTAIRDVVLAPAPHLAPGRDQDFMSDLALLMACKLGSGSDAMLDGSGLFSLHLQVDPDTSKPWSQRGFLSAEAARTAVPMELRV